jgi:hypothetical protein
MSLRCQACRSNGSDCQDHRQQHGFWCSGRRGDRPRPWASCFSHIRLLARVVSSVTSHTQGRGACKIDKPSPHHGTPFQLPLIFLVMQNIRTALQSLPAVQSERGDHSFGKPQSQPAGQLPARLVEIQLAGGPQTVTLRLVQRMVRSDTPIQRKPPSKPDCALAAHERRAQLIAQLHKQAVATASDLAAQRKASTTGAIKDGWRRKAEPWLCTSAFLLALGGVVAVGCILIRAVPWK